MLYKITVDNSTSLKVNVKNSATGSAIIEIPPASIDVLGGIKLYAVNGINRSGLVVYEDGTAVVNTKPERGITRDGVGQIGINPATQTEVTTGTESYKPVTPATLKAEFNRRGIASGGYIYSETPQRIGTWIDGTPMWRVAIKITLTNADFTAGYYELKSKDLGIIEVGKTDSFILSAYLHAGFPPYGMLDSAPIEIGDELRIGLNGISTSYSIINGYIDFVTPEDNINSAKV